jgi:type II secretory pathway component PulF
MIIGSETGNLSKVLEVMEKYYEDEVKYSIKNLMTLLEPLLIVFVGMIVGLIAISIVVPVYQQISAQLEQGLQQRQMP